MSSVLKKIGRGLGEGLELIGKNALEEQREARLMKLRESMASRAADVKFGRDKEMAVAASDARAQESLLKRQFDLERDQTKRTESVYDREDEQVHDEKLKRLEAFYDTIARESKDDAAVELAKLKAALKGAMGDEYTGNSKFDTETTEALKSIMADSVLGRGKEPVAAPKPDVPTQARMTAEMTEDEMLDSAVDTGKAIEVGSRLEPTHASEFIKAQKGAPKHDYRLDFEEGAVTWADLDKQFRTFFGQGRSPADIAKVIDTDERLKHLIPTKKYGKAFYKRKYLGN